MGWGMMARGVREMVRRMEAGERVWVGGWQAAGVEGWMCGVWGEGEREVFKEVVWGKVMGCERGRGVDREGWIGDGGEGRNESCGKYVFWAPVELEGMARRV